MPLLGGLAKMLLLGGLTRVPLLADWLGRCCLRDCLGCCLQASTNTCEKIVATVVVESSCKHRASNDA